MYFPCCRSSRISLPLSCDASLCTFGGLNEEEVEKAVEKEEVPLQIKAVEPPPQLATVEKKEVEVQTDAVEPQTKAVEPPPQLATVQTEADTKNTEGGQEFYAATQKAKRGRFLGWIANTKVPLWVPDLLFENGQTDEDLARELIQNNIKELKNVTFNVKKVKTSWYELLLVKTTEQNYRYFKIEGIEGLKVAEHQFFLEQISNELEIRKYALHRKQKTDIQKKLNH